MAEYNTAPQEADANQDALEESGESGVPQRTDVEEDAPEQPLSQREDPISSSKDERSGCKESCRPSLQLLRSSPTPLEIATWLDCGETTCWLDWPGLQDIERQHPIRNT